MTSELIGILALIVGIVAAVIAYNSKRQDRKIAEFSGALNVPQITLGYEIPSFDPKISNNRTIVYGMPQISDGKYVGKLRFVVANTGKRAAENVKLEIVVPFGANQDTEFMTGRLTKGILPGMSRECFRIEKLVHVYYYLPIINPGENIGIEEPFWIAKTVDRHHSIVAQTKDKKHVKIEAISTFRFVFRLILRHKDELPLTSNVNVCIIEAEDIDAIAKRWVELETEKDGSFPQEGSSAEQSQWLTKQIDRKEFLLVMPAFNKLSKKKSVLFFEDFDKSQRWLLVRSDQEWELQKISLI